MLIDEMIEFAEKDEQRFRETGFTDPYSGGWSLLQNLWKMSTQSDNRFRVLVWLLERRIGYVVLIVRRLRNELSLPQQEGSAETKNKCYLEIDIDAFLHFSYSILNIIAKLTPRFFTHSDRKGLKSKDFNSQRTWFLNHPEMDREYSEYLSAKTSWFIDMEGDRSNLTHHHPIITFRATKNVLASGTHQNEK